VKKLENYENARENGNKHPYDRATSLNLFYAVSVNGFAELHFINNYNVFLFW